MSGTCLASAAKKWWSQACACASSLLLQDVFTCFSPVITITQPAHQAQRQDEPSSCLGKRICSRQVVCCSICCFVIQLLEQRKERDGYKNGQCQLLFIPCHLDNLPAVLLHVYSQLFTALSVALFPLLIYSFLWRDSHISQLSSDQKS